MRAAIAGLIWALLLAGGGHARAEEVYLIGTYEQLTAFSALVLKEDQFTGAAYLINDIEAEGVFTPIGDEAHRFCGLFDGQGHVIRNLAAGGQDFSGLFGFVGNEGVICNLTLENAMVSGGRYSGALAGYSAGRIENCTVSGGRIIGRSECDYGAATGGIVGLTNGTVKNCVSLDTEVYGKRYVGGIAGSLCSGSVERSMSSGRVTGTAQGEGLTGGIVGAVQSGGEVRECIGAAQVRAMRSFDAGGIAGSVFSGSLIKCISLETVYGLEPGAVAGYCARRAQIMSCFYRACGMEGVGEGRPDGTLPLKRSLLRPQTERLLYLIRE